MTGRDRMVLMVIVIVVVLAGGWIKLVSPEREKASKLAAQVTTANASVASAEGKLASAHASQSQYPAAYAAMVNLGKAVPPNQEVPSLIYQLAEATSQKQVDFTSIATSADGAASGSSTVTAPASGKASASASSGTSTSSAGASASAGTLTQMPFTFLFEGTFFDLEHIMRELTSFTTRSSAGTIQVDGRLLTIQSVKLTPANTSGTGGSASLAGTITATAYTAPAQAASGALAATAPGASAASPASSAAGSSSAPAPAVVRVSP